MLPPPPPPPPPQQELDTQLQRALNMEAFDAAKQIRQRREQIDEAVAEFESTKQGRSGTSAVNSSDVRDTVSEVGAAIMRWRFLL